MEEQGQTSLLLIAISCVPPLYALCTGQSISPNPNVKHISTPFPTHPSTSLLSSSSSSSSAASFSSLPSSSLSSVSSVPHPFSLAYLAKEKSLYGVPIELSKYTSSAENGPVQWWEVGRIADFTSGRWLITLFRFLRPILPVRLRARILLYFQSSLLAEIERLVCHTLPPLGLYGAEVDVPTFQRYCHYIIDTMDDSPRNLLLQDALQHCVAQYDAYEVFWFLRKVIRAKDI